MKKIIITLLVFIYFINNSWAAEQQCLIKDSPSPALLKYIENNRKIVKKITNIVSKAKIDENFENNIVENKNDLIRMYNRLINWTGYFSYFNYYIIFPISNDVSYEVKRDYRLLENETKGLENYLKTITKKGYNSVYIKDVCESLNNCKSSEIGLNSEKILETLIKNQSKIIDIYRLIVMGEEITYKNDDLKLVDNNFIEEIEKYYGLGHNCTNSEESFLKRVKKIIKKIKLINTGSEEAIQRWKDAWELLTGPSNTKQYLELETKLLKKELSRQGVSGNSAEAIMNNLKRYNETGGYSENNNFITNSFNHLKNNITNEIKEFKENVLDDVFNKKKKEKLSIDSILKNENNRKINEEIATKISEIYNNELPFSEKSDINTDKIRARIINMHNNLNASIEILDNTIKVSQKVCNSQDAGNGICE